MEEATGAPSSLAVWDPKRLRASGRDGETVMTEPPSPLRMLLYRHTKRREFITLLGGASARSPEDSEHLVEAYRRGLKEGGFVEGQNVAIEFRWAHGDYSRLPALAADLVSRKVSVITAVGGEPSPIAAKAATSTIPIVFLIGGDPVSEGLVERFNRPGGHLTG